jgi:hypothetical protein
MKNETEPNFLLLLPYNDTLIYKITDITIYLKFTHENCEMKSREDNKKIKKNPRKPAKYCVSFLLFTLLNFLLSFARCILLFFQEFFE